MCHNINWLRNMDTRNYVAGVKMCIRLLAIALGLWCAVSTAYSQDWQSPDQVAKVTHQIAVPAGPNSVVNTGTGKLITTVPIVSLPSRGGLSVDFTMTKISDCGNWWYQSRPACGWRHSYQSWVAYDNTVHKYQWNTPFGSYVWNTENFTRKAGNPYDLFSISGGYQVRAKDGTIYEFAHQKGGTGTGYMYLTAIRNTRGDQISLYYDNTTYVDIVTRIVEPSGRHLHLNWETDPGGARRLISVTVEKPDHSVVRTYTLTFSTVAGEWTKLKQITFPAPSAGAQNPFFAFEYGGGATDGFRITSITTPGNNDDSDIEWSYTYDTLHRVTEVAGPEADEGRNSTSPTEASLRFHYPNNKTIDSHSYQVCRVLDGLYTGNTYSTGIESVAADRQHREVHLYRNGSSDPYDDFGPLIAYTIGSQSTDDASSGSTYDSGISSAYPNCYYSNYEWNGSGTEYDGTLKSYRDSGGYLYQYKWYDPTGGNTTTDSRLNLWRITNPKGETTSMTYNSIADQQASVIEVGDEVRVTIENLGFTVWDSTQTVGANGIISLKWDQTYYIVGKTAEEAKYDIQEILLFWYPFPDCPDLNDSDPYVVNTYYTVSFSKNTDTGVDLNHLLKSITDALGHQKYYEYNSYNEPYKIHSDYTGLDLVEESAYDTYGNLSTHKDAYNKQTYYTYDDTHHCFLKTQRDAATNVFTEFGGYDTFGNPGWSRAPRSWNSQSANILETTYTYDNLGRCTRTTNPDSTYVETTYDTNGNRLDFRDENGNIIEWHYDDFGNVNEEVTRAQIGNNTSDSDVMVEYCHDQLGQHKWTKWQRSGLDKYTRSYYDERNRMIKETFPGTKPEWYKYKYDGAGHVKDKSSGHGTTTDRTLTFTYDELGRPYEDKNGSVILAKRTYNSDGTVQKIENTDGYNVQYEYDTAQRERFCTTTYPGSVQRTVEHVYSTPPTKTVTVRVRSGSKTGTIDGSYTYEFNSNLDLEYLTSPAGPKTQYEYSSITGLTTQVNYNTLASLGAAPYTVLTYDDTEKKRLWLDTLVNYRSDGSVISSFDYTYDNCGNRTATAEANGDSTVYTYDDSYNLRSEERKHGTSQIYKYDYEYDEAGNRTKKSLANAASGSPFSYTSSITDNNLLSSVSGAASCTFSYDYFGNRSQLVTSGKTLAYDYDARNKLTAVRQTSPTSATVSSFIYDALQRRIQRTDSSGTVRRFVYDGTDLLAETDSSNNIVSWYTPGVCESRLENSTWNTYYYMCDGLGSTRQLVDTMQRVADAYAYNAWGEEHGHLRPSTDTDKPVNPLRYVGKSGYYSDDDTGLDLLGARYYDPFVGRFITQDPIRDGLNWYGYAGNDPVGEIDPTGLAASRRGRGDLVGMLRPDYYGQLLIGATMRGDKEVGDSSWAMYLWSNEQVNNWVISRLHDEGEGGEIGKPQPVKLNTTVNVGKHDSSEGYDLLGVVHLQMTGTVTRIDDKCYRADIDISVTDTLDLHPLKYPATDGPRWIFARLLGKKAETTFAAKWHGSYYKTPIHPQYIPDIDTIRGVE